MYPSNTSPPQPWQQEEGSRYPPSEGGAYPPPLDHLYHSARGEQPPNGFTGREDGNRHPSREDNRYSSREHAYTRYPQREEDHRNQPSPLHSHSQRPSSPHLGESQVLPLPKAEPHPMGPSMANPDSYRLPPQAMPAQDPYSRMQHQHMSFTQPAPRQRTAIACRYCRRRKIRCSGFESSQDGRCSNCQRFNQECIFTPVSSQTQAFVPAHTQFPQLRQVPGRGGRPEFSQVAVQLYGAHGQPLSVQPPPPGDYPLPGHGYARSSSPGPFEFDQGPFGEPRDDQPNSPPILPPPRGFSPAPTSSSNPTFGYGESAPSTFYQPGPPGPGRRSSPPPPPPPPPFVERPASISPHPSIRPSMWPGPQRPESTGPTTGPSGQTPSLRMGLQNVLDTPPGTQRSAHDHEMLNQLKRGL
ncbi:hypothetical protein L211DRAFT_558223 [Terfezia boudieri ATCC MYA-4762]|uniref:Zn(2)-C6 fungal-type domain-containing protein n=1 Tax=Terfezia boudieri ATCC MYA-4762 TaxID=1051890 RepID=A0A3N4LXH5_9PEZI|nr:hypothetical protein L211DRAFT_558223 [Terfezia boudieri ATCC MYA-4762]